MTSHDPEDHRQREVPPSALYAARAVGEAAGATLLEVEVICSDDDEHRRRAESRKSDVEGLVKPAWAGIVNREYEPWVREPLVLDSSTISPDTAALSIASRMASLGRVAER